MPLKLDATSSAGNGSGTSISTSHTCSGIHRILIVGLVYNDSATNQVSSATYAGVALTSVAVNHNGATSSHMWYQASPATGTNTLQINFSTGLIGINLVVASYNGYLLGSGVGDTDTTDSSSSSITTNMTTNRDKEYPFHFIGSNAVPNVGTNSTRVKGVSGGGKACALDIHTSSPFTGGTAISMTTTFSGSAESASIGATFAAVNQAGIQVVE